MHMLENQMYNMGASQMRTSNVRNNNVSSMRGNTLGASLGATEGMQVSLSFYNHLQLWNLLGNMNKKRQWAPMIISSKEKRDAALEFSQETPVRFERQCCKLCSSHVHEVVHHSRLQQVLAGDIHGIWIPYTTQQNLDQAPGHSIR